MKRTLVIGCILAALFATAIMADDNDVKAQGAIQDFGDSYVTVDGTTFNIDDNTVFKNGSKSDLAVGAFVSVEGHMNEGTLVADEIEFKENDNGGGDGSGHHGNEIKETGEIDSVSGNDFTVNGTTFTVDDNTKFDHGTRDDLAPGRMVKVEGHDDNGSIIASEVEFKNNGNGGGHESDEVEVKGMVTAVGDGVFTVGGMEFSITPQTHFIRMSEGDLAVGIMVEVEGEDKGNGVIEAVKVKLEGNNGDSRGATAETGVLASVNDLGGGLVELVLEDGTTMVVDEDTRLSGRHGLKCKAKDLIPGLTVRLQYKKSMTVTEGERQEATHLSIIGNEAVKGLVSGVATASIEGSIMVGDAEVKYDKRTVVQGDTDVKDPSEIPDGQYVVALSNPLADGSYLGNRIIVTDEDNSNDGDLLGRKMKFYGIISAISGGGTLDGFSIDDQAFTVDENTEFKVKGCDEPFDPSLLAEGMSVRVLAVKDGSGGYIAVYVTVQLPIFKFTGQLDAYSATALSMLGVDMEITSYTEFKDVVPGDLGVGSFVEVKAIQWPDDTLIVCEIELAEEDNEEFEVQGIISDKTVDGDNVLITVGGLIVVVQPDTDIRSKDMILGVDDLAIGVFVQVSGYISATDDYIAKHIKVR